MDLLKDQEGSRRDSGRRARARAEEEGVADACVVSRCIRLAMAAETMAPSNRSWHHPLTTTEHRSCLHVFGRPARSLTVTRTRARFALPPRLIACRNGGVPTRCRHYGDSCAPRHHRRAVCHRRLSCHPGRQDTRFGALCRILPRLRSYSRCLCVGVCVHVMLCCWTLS